MAIKGNALQRLILNYLFCSPPSTSGLDISTTTTTRLWIALHTADPGSDGTQSTNEVSYGGYARVATQRTASGSDPGGWVLDADALSALVSPMSNIQFPVCSTASTVALNNWSIGFSSAGGSNHEMIYTGSFRTQTPILVQGTGPYLTTGSAVREF